MPDVELGLVADIPPGTMRQFQAGDDKVLVCNLNGTFHAVNGECPHRGAMLGQGQLHGALVVCPWHNWAFDVRTGEGISNPLAKLCRFEVVVAGDKLVIKKPEAAT